MMQLDLQTRRAVYDGAIERGKIPSASEVAESLGASEDDVRASLRRLAGAHMLVLQESGEVLMANPFSAVPTPFVVTARGRSWYANCIWDGMGVAAMLDSDALIDASCGCCGASMRLEVPAQCLDEDERVAHFAIPAKHWWDDIVFN